MAAASNAPGATPGWDARWRSALREAASARVVLPSLRTAAAAATAYGISRSLGLPEAYWAALSAVIISRPHAGAAMQAAAARVGATVLGVCLGCLGAVARAEGAPEWFILLLVLALLGLIPSGRTACVAALIMLAAPSPGHAPLGAAFLRVAEISIGITTATGFIWFFVPGHAGREACHRARTLHAALALALEQARQGNFQECERLQRQAGQELFALTALARAPRWGGKSGSALETLRSAARRLNVAASFAIRALAAAHRDKNPLLVEESFVRRCAALHPDTRQSVSPSLGSSPLSAAAPAQEKNALTLQTHALHYAVGMALRDAAALRELLEPGTPAASAMPQNGGSHVTQ